MAGDLPDIPGRQAPREGVQAITQEISYLLRYDSNKFPGAMPVSFARRHLKKDLLEEDYFVCEKSDGLRCLMYLASYEGQERVYLITRKYEVFYIEQFHVPLNEQDPGSFHSLGSLIDGELVKTSDGSLKFLMFDMLAMNGECLVSRTLDKRLGYLRAHVYKPFQKLLTAFPDDTSLFPFKMVMKPMELSYGLTKVLAEQHSHLSDGLIFTSREAPYQYGTDPKILKWKPAEENSVDFRMNLDFKIYHDPNLNESWPDYDSLPQVHLMVWHGKNIYKEYGELFLESEEWEKLKAAEEPLNDRIVECSKDDKGRWRMLRFRDDKTDANFVATVDSVIESINDRVSEQELLSSVDEIRDRWHKRAERKKRSTESMRDSAELKRLRS